MADVSRETVLAEFFPPERRDLVTRYAELLSVDGVTRGLIGPREAPRLWERHLANCAALAELVPPERTVVDIGSGAGLPGLVLALARPDLEVTLVEPLLRRTRFLEEVVAELGLAVEILRCRAEDLHGARRFDVVTSRAVAPLERLAAWCMPLVTPTGVMLAMKGSTAADEVAGCAPALAAAGYADAELLTLGAGRLVVPTYVVRLAWAEPGQVGWPPAATRGARSGTSRPSRRSGPARPRRRRA